MWGLDVDRWWECEGKESEKTKSGRRSKKGRKESLFVSSIFEVLEFQGRPRNNLAFKCSLFFSQAVSGDWPWGENSCIAPARERLLSFSSFPPRPALLNSHGQKWRKPHISAFCPVHIRAGALPPPQSSGGSLSQPTPALCRASMCHFVSAKYHWD